MRKNSLLIKLLKFRRICDKIVDQRLKCFNVEIKNRKTIFIVWLILFDKLFVWEWYAIEYINAIFKRMNITVHMFEKNFRSRSKIIVFDKSQSIKFKWSNKTCFHWTTIHVIWFEINIIRLKCLQLQNMTQSKKFFNEIDNVNMKSIVMIWKKIVEISIDCKNSYDLWRRV